MDIGKNNYFYERKKRINWEYQLLIDVSKYCGERSDLIRRLSLLDIEDKSERQLQGGNFVSELKAFKHCIDNGFLPTWIPESRQNGVKSPDFYIKVANLELPVEVKTLNLPQEEGDFLRLAKGSPVSEKQVTLVEPSFDVKIKGGCSDAIEKFKHFLKIEDSDSSPRGLIWFSYIPSEMVRQEDGGAPRMVEYVRDFAESITPEDVSVFVENGWADLD